MSLEQSPVQLARCNGVATLTLNRPQQFNALSSALLSALQSALDEVASDRQVRVLVLAASGKAFCAGHDLREMMAHPDTVWQERLFRQCSRVMLTIGSMPQVVIARVHGIATAAGCQLVASCDLAIAAESARFATSGVNLGLFCSTPAVALTQIMAKKHAAEMLFTGEFIEARQAADIGLVNRCVADADLDTQIELMSDNIAAKSGHALASGKALLSQLRNVSLSSAYAHASQTMACDMQSEDAQSGIKAFLEKKTPQTWKHQ